MASKNSEFAQMQGAGEILSRRICVYMQARNFSRNTAVGMKWFKQASRAADARKSVFLEGSFDAR
jgi:hypothetical protein